MIFVLALVLVLSPYIFYFDLRLRGFRGLFQELFRQQHYNTSSALSELFVNTIDVVGFKTSSFKCNQLLSNLIYFASVVEGST